MTRLENGGSQPRQVTLRFEVFQNGKAVAVPIPEKSVTVAGGTVAEVAVECARRRSGALDAAESGLGQNGDDRAGKRPGAGHFRPQVRISRLESQGHGACPERQAHPILRVGCNGRMPQDFYEADNRRQLLPGTRR